jgi:hypothetical protein
MVNDPHTAGDFVRNFLTHIVNGLPKFLGAVLILIVSYFVAKGIAAVIHNALGRAQLNQRLHAGKGGNIIQRAIPNPMGVIASIAYWVIFLFGASIAVSYLGIGFLEAFIRGIYAYIPNVIAAMLIFLVAGAISGGVATLVTNAMGDTPTGKIIATAAPTVIMSIAGFMILNQLKIAPAIVTETYGAIVFALALGFALAFGLGGRDVASQMLGDLYSKGQASKGQVKADMRTGANRAKDKSSDLRDRAS